MPLRWEQVRIQVAAGHGVVSLVHEVSLGLTRGRTHALVGESGSGKSITALAAMRLLPPGMRIQGRITYENVDITAMDAEQVRRLRGNRVAMIFQEPMSSLNPVMTVGRQIAEPLELHRGLYGTMARKAAVELLARVGIADPAERFRAYPHELSGGMRQRVMIAIALACHPSVLIADEPTTALDVTVQAQILELLKDLQQETGMAILFITHDLAVVARFAHHTSVMYAGNIVESAPTAELLRSAHHPYTRALLRSVPRLHDPVLPPDSPPTASQHGRSLPTIGGEVPVPGNLPPGCAFEPRCDVASGDDRCRQETPTLSAVNHERLCACWKPV